MKYQSPRHGGKIKTPVIINLLLMLACLTTPLKAQTERGVKNTKVEQKIALIIGNTNYDNSIGKLTNPVNDAVDMAESLKRLGFTLVGGKPQMDVNRRQLLALIRDFGQQIKQGGIGFFYFSGHGVQVNKENYIIPITDALVYEDDAESEAVKVDMVAKEMELAGNRLNILVLDACRSNGLQKRTRNAEKGLTEPSRKPEGTFIAFSAGDGQTASDGIGKNGLFTQELLKNLEKPNVRLDDIFRTTRNEVKRLSENRQIPVLFDSTSEAFFLNFDTNSSRTNIQESTRFSTRLNKLGMEFITIPKGVFIIGSPLSEKERRDDESPQKQIKITDDFWMGRYEVTQAQWKAVMGTLPNDDCLKNERLSSNLPVICVSWDTVNKFIDKLNATGDGFVYDLPTEAEWEYAARAKTNTRYYWGDDFGKTQACKYENVIDLSDKESTKNPNDYPNFANCRDGYVGLAPVGQFLPNGFGLYDMSGNVSEWTKDVCDVNEMDYKNLNEFGINSRKLINDEFEQFIIRGYGRTASRSCSNRNNQYYGEVDGYNNVGFRLVARERKSK